MTPAAASPAPAIDPVCGMNVDEAEAKTAKLTTEYQGKMYFFCNETCKQKFDVSPGKHLAAPGAK